MLARNRTIRTCDTRRDCEGIDEIDSYATTAANKKLDGDDLMILDTVRTGSSWTKVAAYKTGKTDDEACDLCGDPREESDHFWTCSALHEERIKADPEIAGIPPEVFPIPIRHGIAPAMAADVRLPFWGTWYKGDGNLIEDPGSKLNFRQKMFCGCSDEYQTNREMRNVLSKMDEQIEKGTRRITAREYVQHHTKQDGCEHLPPRTPSL